MFRFNYFYNNLSFLILYYICIIKEKKILTSRFESNFKPSFFELNWAEFDITQNWPYYNHIELIYFKIEFRIELKINQLRSQKILNKLTRAQPCTRGGQCTIICWLSRREYLCLLGLSFFLVGALRCFPWAKWSENEKKPTFDMHVIGIPTSEIEVVNT